MLESSFSSLEKTGGGSKCHGSVPAEHLKELPTWKAPVAGSSQLEGNIDRDARGVFFWDDDSMMTVITHDFML